MLLIYPDSNGFHGQRKMGGTGAKQFLDSLQVGLVEVRLSPVVLAEVERQEREAAAEDCAKLMKAVSTFARQFPDEDISALTREAEALTTAIERDAGALGPLLKHDACSMTPFPPSTAEELVARELQRRRPTLLKDSQSIGLRDQVIWDGCRDLLRETQATGDEIVFVTSDNGFLDESRALHPHLLEDLATDGISGDRITVAHSLPEATLAAETHREIIGSSHANIAVAAIDYLLKLQGSRWDDSIGNLDDAPLHGLYERPPLIAEVSLVEADEIEPGNPTTVEMYAYLTLRGEFWSWLPDDVAIGELEIDGPVDGHFWTNLKTSVAVTAEVQYDEVPGSAASNPRVVSASFAWNW